MKNKKAIGKSYSKRQQSWGKKKQLLRKKIIPNLGGMPRGRTELGKSYPYPFPLKKFLKNLTS